MNAAMSDDPILFSRDGHIARNESALIANTRQA